MSTLFNVLVKRIFVITLIALSSCKDSDKKSSLIFEELNESLERSNNLIENSTSEMLFTLKGKTYQPVTQEKAIFWFSKADSIDSKAKYLIDFIAGLRSNFKQNKIQIGPNTSRDLFKKLIAFKGFIQQQNLYLKTREKIDTIILGKGIKDETDFYKIKFLDKDAIQINNALLKFENDILIVINSIVSFCNNEASGCWCGFVEKFQAIAGSNSSVFKKGQEMIITAGVGEFNLDRKPSFLINGVEVAPNENGVGEYKMKINKQPGDYRAHVKISYTMSDGREVTIAKDIEYTVIDSPSNDKKVSRNLSGSDTTMSP